MKCEHKTEEEYRVCTCCGTFRRIAVAAKKMLEARQEYLDRLLVAPKDLDEAQVVMTERVKNLEREVKFATDANLWDE